MCWYDCVCIYMWWWNISLYIHVLTWLYVCNCRHVLWSSSPNYILEMLIRNYEHNYPRANRFVSTKGHASTSHYRGLLDRLAMEDGIWVPYDDHRDVMPFQDSCWYFSWVVFVGFLVFFYYIFLVFMTFWRTLM